jgi:hypothetical protein
MRLPNIDWQRVDVYCLAKTLWVLATGIEPPPGGQIRADDIWALARRGLPEPYVSELDAVIQRATSENPLARYSTGGLRDAIGAWIDAVEMRQGIVAADIRRRENLTAVLRWVIGWARARASNFGRGLVEIGDLDAQSAVEGLSNDELAEALQGLRGQQMVEGEPEFATRNEPIAWSRLFPTFWGVEEIEEQTALRAQVAPLVRALISGPRQSITLTPDAESELGVRSPGPEMYYRLRYLRSRGWIDFDELAEGGGGITLLNVRITERGRAWAAALD